MSGYDHGSGNIGVGKQHEELLSAGAHGRIADADRRPQVVPNRA